MDQAGSPESAGVSLDLAGDAEPVTMSNARSEDTDSVTDSATNNALASPETPNTSLINPWADPSPSHSLNTTPILAASDAPDTTTESDSIVDLVLANSEGPSTPPLATVEHPDTLALQHDTDGVRLPDEDKNTGTPPADKEDVFVVPSLPSPRKNRLIKSHHVRAKSSLQEPDMAALLAKLEMENQAIAKDPKSGIAAVGGHTGPDASFEYHVRDDVCSSLSLVNIPEDALGMSLGEFWALVTKDFNEALRLLPTMTPLMIHKGVPEILRSAVWVGITTAWDASLQAEFESLCDRLQYEQPQNEHIINKDLPRCFPHHEFYRDADGEGQRMLGTLLKCYALYDAETGYCQGMAFVAGALLLNMPLKDAFCVFVRLMEKHNLRTLYSIDLRGLHMRTFQLKKFMGQISSELLEHLTSIGLEMSYLSQWFMSLFATSCPLNILFRIYDVVFAEGADETIMRVALALIVSNEHKLLGMTELEEVLHLLLGRSLWEPYVTEPDFLMDEIARLSNVVSREELAKLEQLFEEQSAEESGEKTAQALGFASGFGGFRIFDHFRTPSSSKTPGRLQPTTPLLDMPNGHGPRQSVSKGSTSTLGSASASYSLMSGDSLTSTVATELDGDRSSIKTSKSGRTLEDRSLHEQVEGLLLALSEVQREAAETAAQLQAENKRKESVAAIVMKLRDLISQKEQLNTAVKRDRSHTMPSRTELDQAQKKLKHLRKKSIVISEAAQTISVNNLASSAPDAELQQSLQRLCCLLESQSNKSTPITDAGGFEPRTPFTPVNDVQLNARPMRHDSGLNGGSTGSPTKRTGMPLRLQTTSAGDDGPIPQIVHVPDTPIDYYEEEEDYWPGPGMLTNSSAALSPVPSAPSTPAPAPRQSSLQAREVLRVSGSVPPADEAMLVELVNAKTREATAMHEREEMKVQLDKMRRTAEESLARETAMAARLAEMERLLAAQQLAMQAQDDLHSSELARLNDSAVVMSRQPSRSPGIEKSQSEASLWPIGTPGGATTPTGTGGMLAEPTSTGGWGWFKKQRSVSTGAAV